MVKCMRTIAFCFVCGLLLTLMPFRASGQDISIRNNLLYDASGTVNAGLEFQVGEHFSVGVNGGFKSWPRFLAWDNDNVNNTTHWRHFLVAPEGRYYFSEVFKGAFVGADFVYTHFNVGNLKLPFGLYPEVATRREQGSWWGAGLFVGYAWWPWQHWRIEIEGGAGVGLAAYDSYDCDHCGSKLEEVRRAAVVPKLGLNIAYNPVARDKRKSRVRVIEKTDTLTVLQAPVAFVVNLKEVAGPESAGDRLAKQEPWVIPIEKYRPLDYLTRPGKDSIQYVVFPASSAVLERQTGRNAAVLDRLQGAIETIRDDEATDEILVSIVGLSSIEGPRAQNDSLSVRRARAVADYLNGRTFVSRKFFETIGKGEAWDWFKDQLKAHPEGNEKLLEIVFNEPDADARERKIKQDPELYRKVKEEFLADQRNSGFIRVYYSNRPDAVTEKWNGPVAELLKAKHYAQAVAAIQSDEALLSRVKTDAEAANAYGIALYFTALDNRDQALEEQALSLLQEAARMGSAPARHNLEGTRVYGPARKEYEAWMDVMKEKQ